MQDLVKSLSNYIDHSEHITKRMKAMKDYNQILFEDKLEIKADRVEKVGKSIKKQSAELEQRKVKIRKTEREKARQIQTNKKQLEQTGVRKRELLNLKRDEIEENNRIEKNLRLITKKRLVDKQE